LEKPEWYELYENPLLNRYFVEFASNRTSYQYIQKDLVQEAWLRIGEFLAGWDPFAELSGQKANYSTSVDEFYRREQKSLDFYRKLGEKAINAAYMREWRQWDKGRKLRGLKDRDYRLRKKFKECASRGGFARN
jgi:hypothetical protein